MASNLGSGSGSGSDFSKEPFARLMGEIPERTSSKKATSYLETARKVSGSLEAYQGTIKRKVSLARDTLKPVLCNEC